MNFVAKKGVIIDAGAFAGASAFCFASGLASNKAGPFSRKCIHSYDLFRVDEPYVQDYIVNNFQPVKRGDLFSPFSNNKRRNMRILYQFMKAILQGKNVRKI